MSTTSNERRGTKCKAPGTVRSRTKQRKAEAVGVKGEEDGDHMVEYMGVMANSVTNLVEVM